MEKFLCIGKIVKPVGIKGEFKVIPYTDNINRFKELKHFYFENDEQKQVVEKVTLRGDFVTLKIVGIDNPEQVDFLREKCIFVDRENSVKLDQDHFFIVDLVGCEIIGANGKNQGRIVDVENYGASDIIVFEKNGKEYSVPFLKDVFGKIDVENMKVYVTDRFFEVLV